MVQREAVIVGAVRLPQGKRNGVYKDTRSEVMLSEVLKELLRRSGIDSIEVDDVIVGCVSQLQEQGNNIARISSLMAGMAEEVPAMTLNRKCGSSQEAVNIAAQAIISGDKNVVIAAGIENMSRHHMGSDKVKEPAALLEEYEMISQGEAAERVADKWGISRKELDEYALRSHKLAADSRDKGLFAREIHPLEVRLDAGKKIVSEDEGIRADSNMEVLAGLKPVFRENGKITAGNSSQISDGSAAILLMSNEKAKSLGIKPRAKVIARDSIGDSPTLMLTGIIPLTKRILKKARLSLNDIDTFECNEAFASVVISWMKELQPDSNKVNPRGGGIALGHPTGASGARIMTTLLHELEDANKKYGMQVMCCGGGMATATIIERIT